jgi:hypothetical protein
MEKPTDLKEIKRKLERVKIFPPKGLGNSEDEPKVSLADDHEF